jgi:Protein of unknown function, DUF481
MRSQAARRGAPSGSWRRFSILLPATLGAALATLAAPGTVRAQSVLNTERVEPQDVSGFFTSVDLATTFQGGNARVVSLKGNGAFGYRAKRSWIVAVGGLSYLNSAHKVSTEDRYAQIRYGWFLSPRTRTFHFVQVQDSRELALAHRVLVGSGVRHSFVWNDHSRLGLGVGLMWEAERLDVGALPAGTAATSDDVRGDVIAFAARKLSATAHLTDQLYFEPRVDAPADVRLLEQLRFSVSAAKGVDLSVGLDWLHDSRPPPTVGPDDVEMDTSLSLTVK